MNNITKKLIFVFSLSFFASFILFSSNEVTAALNCQIENGGCTGGKVSLLRMSALTNAHAEFEGLGVYSEYLCCSDDTGVLVGRNCIAPNDIFLHLSTPNTNAHIEKNTLGFYLNNGCISVNVGNILCTYGNPTCPVSSTCLASMSADTNAHIGDCSAYSEKICCGIVPPPCGNVDGVCDIAGGCTPYVDTDCPDICGDAVKTGTEMCDIANNIGCNSLAPLCQAGCGLCVAPPCGPADGFCMPTCDATDPDCPEICGDGIKSGLEGCDRFGDIGCGGLSPKCQNNCSSCTCALASNLTFFGKPIACTVQDLILFILSIAGKIVLLMLIIGGIFYVVSGSNPQNQEKAKKIILYTLIGLILVLSSYAILSVLNKFFTEP
ncbi:MAG: pilin [Patescibacteria group bacterium]|nr:pilin [Patescibacteria group bacterium]